ncbi:uncharacterized protein [Rhodnius prolixus]|uniref:uncharacterized protein n=1 Tax=Rhodnius prolixus TaxID=13249 RepID=UPI003D18A73A
MKNVKWDLIGLSEVRRNGEECIELQNNMKFYYNGDGSIGGTGFLVNKHLANQITSFKSYSQRVSKLIWNPGRKKIGRIKIIQIYAPTSDSTEEELEEFYGKLQPAVDEDPCRFTIIIGDWNAKVGKTEGENAVGGFGFGERNERGNEMIEFAEANNLAIMNTFFKKDPERKWTWISPDGNTKNEIDYVIVNRKEIVIDVDTEDNINIGSDHKAIKATVKLKFRRKTYQQSRKSEIDKKQLMSQEFENKLILNLDKEKDTTKDLNRMEKRLVKAIKETTEEKRRKLKRKGREKIEFTEISKTIRRMINEWNSKKKIEEMEEVIQTGSSLKKCIKSQMLGRKSIIAMKDKNGIIKTEKEDILNIICDFYSELYSAPEPIDQVHYDNQDLAELQKILPCEVENAISKLKCGKTGGLDDIVNEQLKVGGEKLAIELCDLFNNLFTKTPNCKLTLEIKERILKYEEVYVKEMYLLQRYLE